jgi:hypothetical protein
MTSALETLRKAIRDLHGCDSIHLMSVPVHETFQGKTAWEGTVQVFLLVDHPKAKEGYAWSYTADNGETRYVAVLGVPPISTAIDAVRAYIASQAQKQK